MQKSPHCQCQPKRASKKVGGIFSFLPGLLIALLPKCPFCILTYTSAITICSSKSLSGYTPHWTSWISIVFSILTLIITLYNYKGQRTWLAALFILSGSAVITYSELYSGLIQPYYWGCGILIFGVWINGSLPYFIRLIVPFPKMPVISTRPKVISFRYSGLNNE